MGIPISTDARMYYRCAFRRYGDARALLNVDHHTGAVYLAGYGVECILKALLVAAVPPDLQAELVGTFRGAKAHDLRWLRSQYLLGSGRRTLPREVAGQFALVTSWSTDLRYSPAELRRPDAVTFLAAADAILRWADGRL